MSRPREEDAAVAIVGMACIFPGAPDLETYWRNLRDGVDAITSVPPTRIDPVFFDAKSKSADRFYCGRGGFIDAFADFDAQSLGVMPVAARGADPDQLLALQVAVRAVADAGFDGRPFARDRAAVIIGRGGYPGPGRARLDTHVRVAEQVAATLRATVPGIDEATIARVKSELQAQVAAPGADAAIGLVPNLVASRIAHRLDLHGPAFTVDAACASALVAVDHGVNELRSGRSDVVVAGGVHLCHDESFWSVFTQLGALSRKQQIRPFDRRADGLLIGEGIGLIVLERLADAEARGARVYAVIRGVGTSSDGRGASLMSPAVEGQVLALERAYRDAGIDPDTVGLLEAHGTATAAGDAAELTTIARVFGAATSDRPRAVLGSVKSMIGHAMPAAGAAGLIKAALAIHHRTLLPSLHCEHASALLDATRFRVVGKSEPWATDTASPSPRRAGVSAFGFGGVNAHVVLSELDAGSASRATSTKKPEIPDDRVAVFSAPDVASLVARIDCDTRATDGGVVRLVVFDPTKERLARAREIASRWRPWRGRDGIWFSPKGLLADGGTLAFMFPGVDATFEPRVDDIAQHFGLTVPQHTRPRDLEEQGFGIVGVNRLLDAVVRKLGVKPHDVCGHSVGEWSGMISSGLIADADLDAFLATLRPGSLEVPGVLFAAAGCSVDRAKAAISGLEEIALSHDNCPHQVLLCGRESSIAEAMKRLRADGVFCQQLPFKSGFHSPLFADYLAPHRAHFARLALSPMREPLWSATTVEPYPESPDDVRALAMRHLVEPVRFRELIEAMYARGTRVFVQVGTGSLVNFAEDTLRGRPALALAANVKERSGLSQLRRLLAALFVEGLDVDPTRLSAKASTPMSLALGLPIAREFTPIASLPNGKQEPLIAEGHPLAASFARGMRALAEAQSAVFAKLAPEPAERSLARESTTVRTLSIATMPELIDHSFFRQARGWPVLSDRHPVVPMTASIDLMIEHATAMIPGKVAVAVEDVRAYRWLVVSTPVDVKFHCAFDGVDRVHVKIGDYSEATVVLADRYPDLPSADEAPLLDAAPAIHHARAFYDDRWMFHGPAYQGVIDVGVVGEDGVRGMIETGEARGALLDNAGQLFGYWVMVRTEVNRMAMPVRIARVSLYGPHPRAGERLVCTVRITSLDDTSVVADLSLARGDRAWAVIEQWEDRRFETDAKLWQVLQWPEKNLLSTIDPRGVTIFEDRYRGAPTRDQLSRRYLGEAERAEYTSQVPRVQRAWLAGRIAAKDAARDFFWKSGLGDLFPAEVTIDRDDRGRLIAKTAMARRLCVAVAHADEVAIAVVRESGDVGAAIAAVTPITPATEALDAAELALFEQDPPDEARARILAAREAAARSSEGGLPLGKEALRVRDRFGQRLLVGDRWVETARHRDQILAWTNP